MRYIYLLKRCYGEYEEYTEEILDAFKIYRNALKSLYYYFNNFYRKFSKIGEIYNLEMYIVDKNKNLNY